jgi:hypothetical protein
MKEGPVILALQEGRDWEDDSSSSAQAEKLLRPDLNKSGFCGCNASYMGGIRRTI